MPRGDGTGPMGTGPMSGRQAGYCVGYDAPGYANPAPRLGLARGFRGGRRGRRNMFYATGLPRWARESFAPPTLKAQADWLKEQIETIAKRIEEIEQK